MIGQLALRNITYRPWRSVLLFFGVEKAIHRFETTVDVQRLDQ